MEGDHERQRVVLHEQRQFYEGHANFNIRQTMFSPQGIIHEGEEQPFSLF